VDKSVAHKGGSDFEVTLSALGQSFQR